MTTTDVRDDLLSPQAFSFRLACVTKCQVCGWEAVGAADGLEAFFDGEGSWRDAIEEVLTLSREHVEREHPER